MKLAASVLGLGAVVSALPGPEIPVSYDGHHVYRIQASTPRDIEAIEHRFARYPSVHSAEALELVIPPGDVASFEEALGLDATLLSIDLGAQIRAESAPAHDTYSRRSMHRRTNGTLPDLSWFDSYHAYADHLAWWDAVVAAFPGNAEKITLGQSYEGRDLHAFHLWGDDGVSSEKPIILWHGTVHAREWISTMVVEYLTYQLVDGFKKGDADVTAFLDHYDFWIVPFHNPDGFVYTQTTNRLWRKSRQPRSNATCIGTDLNRNWVCAPFFFFPSLSCPPFLLDARPV